MNYMRYNALTRKNEKNFFCYFVSFPAVGVVRNSTLHYYYWGSCTKS